MIDKLPSGSLSLDCLVPASMANAAGKRALPVSDLLQAAAVRPGDASSAEPIRGSFAVRAFPPVPGDSVTVMLVGVQTP